MSESVLEVLQKVKASIGDRKAYLYGRAILDILIGESPKNFSIFIKVHHAECRDKVMQSLPHSKQIYYTLGTSFTALDTFTINFPFGISPSFRCTLQPEPINIVGVQVKPKDNK